MTEQESLLLKNLLEKVRQAQTLGAVDLDKLYRLAVKQAGDRGRQLAEEEKIFHQEENRKVATG